MNHIYIYIYIYPSGGRFTGNSCPVGVYIYEVTTWLMLRKWWGGVGMIPFLALAHMVGATQHHVSCTCTHGWCYATSCFLHLHTWLVLRNIMFLATHGRCYATSWGGVGLGWGGVGVITFLALAHMVGATQHHVSCTCTHGRCYATSCL